MPRQLDIKYNNQASSVPLEKVHIKVFVTRSHNFRARIKEPDNPAAYEVTIGGKQWELGKGMEHRDTILRKCKLMLSVLNTKLKQI